MYIWFVRICIIVGVVAVAYLLFRLFGWIYGSIENRVYKKHGIWAHAVVCLFGILWLLAMGVFIQFIYSYGEVVYVEPGRHKYHIYKDCPEMLSKTKQTLRFQAQENNYHLCDRCAVTRGEPPEEEIYIDWDDD